MPDEEKAHSSKKVSSCSLKDYREIKPKYKIFNSWTLGLTVAQESNLSKGQDLQEARGELLETMEIHISK